MQARLGNGGVLSWTHDQRNADAPSSVLRTLAVYLRGDWLEHAGAHARLAGCGTGVAMTG